MATLIAIFVHNGKERPAVKRGKKVVAGCIPGLYKQAEHFIGPAGFYYHIAPSEADAKLAEMNRRGIIDIVISPDSDLFTLGACCVVTINVEETKKLRELVVDIYDVEAINLFCLLLWLEMTWIKGYLIVEQSSHWVHTGHVREAQECLQNLKSNIICVLEENPAGTLPNKVPALANFLHFNEFPKHLPLDTFTKPLTSWTCLPNGPPAAASWVPQIVDLGGMAESCCSFLTWDNEEVLGKFMKSVYSSSDVVGQAGLNTLGQSRASEGLGLLNIEPKP
ncbi:PIN domain-like protein [Moniliophthora roreri MCA 2997]|uniref:PIN domain-like protein n=1 Tax=Moniliophthora roreri (strain MCA 2997) TaxID=1381753 RepID=V2WPZ1_MONRO|nr:PIN domain-like protein [Moniliophthora roreri MCA 2997]